MFEDCHTHICTDSRCFSCSYPQVLCCWQERGSESALQGDHSAAIRAWDSALALLPDNAAVLHELKAQVYLERDRAWDAVQSASKAASLAPSWPEGHVTLGRSQLNLGEVMRQLSKLPVFCPTQPLCLRCWCAKPRYQELEHGSLATAHVAKGVVLMLTKSPCVLLLQP